ncbi:MAG: FG-GAP repeat domain-containing protein [Chitinophagaceae bacterium]
MKPIDSPSCLFQNLFRAGSLIFPLLLALASCITKKQENTLFQLQEHTGIDFVNTVSNTKDFNIFSYRNFYNGGGVAIGDLNNDGLADVFFTANMGPNKLFVNNGQWAFDDISEQAGISDAGQWSTGVVLVDINGDGWLDIYVCNAGFINGQPPRSRLYINNRNLTFTDSAEAYNLANTGGYATHAAFFDQDLDGDLDVFIINNSFIPVNTLNYANKRDLRAKDWPVADYLKGGGDRFLRNEGGRFTDVSEASGIYGSLISFGLGVTVGDVNGDHYPDVYVSNDFFERDYLYINQRDGTFKDELEQWVQHLSHSSMGADMADINNDGYPDLFVTEMLPDNDFRLKTTTSFENIDVQQLKVKSGFYYQFMQNTLQVNRGNGRFSETAFYSHVAASDWSWGGLIFDADNDGLSDLYVCNGIYNDVTNQDFIDFFANDVIQKMVLTGQKEQVEEIINKMPSTPILNKAFHNQGQLRFREVGQEWGFSQPSFSNGAAYGDLDNDGDLDLVMNNVNQPAFIYRNFSREHISKLGNLAQNVSSQVQHGRKRQTFCVLLLKVSKNLKIYNPAILLDLFPGY